MSKYTEEVASRLYSYFVEKLDLVENSKNWLVGTCPHCGKVRKFGINVHIGLTNCFVCGVKMGPIALVKQLEDFNTFHEVYKLLDNFEAFSIELGDHFRVAEKPDINILKTLPDEYKLLGLYDTKLDKLVRKQLKQRGFSLNQSMSLGIGYCAKGEFRQRIIIPFYRQGQVVYFNARQITKSGTKYKNPNEDQFGIGKGKVIYNHDALYFYNRVWLFEGVFNALTIGSNAIATGGKQLSSYQLNELIKSPCKKIIIGWDDDAYFEALKLALAISPFKKVKILKFPKGKDANDLGRKATKELEKNTSYMTYSQIYSEFIITREI